MAATLPSITFHHTFGRLSHEDAGESTLLPFHSGIRHSCSEKCHILLVYLPERGICLARLICDAAWLREVYFHDAILPAFFITSVSRAASLTTTATY